jgi:hypothetical protein
MSSSPAPVRKRPRVLLLMLFLLLQTALLAGAIWFGAHLAPMPVPLPPHDEPPPAVTPPPADDPADSPLHAVAQLPPLSLREGQTGAE